MPFIDVVHYKHSLKERAIDIPEQVCIMRDNVQVGVDALLFSPRMAALRSSQPFLTVFLVSLCIFLTSVSFDASILDSRWRIGKCGATSGFGMRLSF